MKAKFMILIAGMLCLVSSFAGNDTSAERNKWHVSVGGAFNGSVRSSLSMRNLPIPASGYRGSSLPSKSEAENAARSGKYGDQGFIFNDDATTASYCFTENWKINKSAKTGVDSEGTSEFLLRNQYEEIDPNATVYGQTDCNVSDDRNQFGVSAEISREIWIHDEKDEHLWGVDFAAAFSYFFGRDIFRASRFQTRSDKVLNGSWDTTVKDAAATWDYDHEGRPLNSGMWYGEGSQTPIGGPALDLGTGVTGPVLNENAPMVYSSSTSYFASGDYQELEMLFMLRPWYEITDWWRVFAQVGLGVSWGRFDTSFHSGGLSHDEDFSQWDCYGVAGLGTVFRYDDWTLGVDFLGRFLRDDLDVDGRYVSGSIERSNWGFRVMLGYEF